LKTKLLLKDGFKIVRNISGVPHTISCAGITDDFNLPLSFQGVKADNTGNIEPYKAYTALLSQLGTANIAVTELQNTIGTANWNTSTGFYSTIIDIVFNPLKTFMAGISLATSRYVTIPFSTGTSGAISGYLLVYYGDDGNGKLLIEVDAVDSSFNAVDLSTIITNTGVFSLPEIRIYP
jgi:hypothetical protein